MLCCSRSKKETSEKGTGKYKTRLCSVCETLQTICGSKKPQKNQIHHVYRKVLLYVLSSNASSDWEEYNNSNNNNKKEKQASKGNFEYKLKQWHRPLTEKNIKMRQSKHSYDKKWVRFQANCLFDVDQVSLRFATDRKTTYKVHVPKSQKKYHQAWVSQPESGFPEDTGHELNVNKTFRRRPGRSIYVLCLLGQIKDSAHCKIVPP